MSGLVSVVLLLFVTVLDGAFSTSLPTWFCFPLVGFPVICSLNRPQSDVIINFFFHHLVGFYLLCVDVSRFVFASKLLLLAYKYFTCSVRTLQMQCFRRQPALPPPLCFVHFSYLLRWVCCLNSALNVVIYHLLLGFVRSSVTRLTDTWSMFLCLSLWLFSYSRTAKCTVRTLFSVFESVF